MAYDKEALRKARVRLVEHRLEVAQGFADTISEARLYLLNKIQRAIEIVDATMKEAETYRSSRWDDPG